MTDPIFEEAESVPVGRKARTIGKELWNALADSAKRGVAFSRTGTASVIDELRKDLSSAAVRAKYDVTTGTMQVEGGMHKLTFAARGKDAPEASGTTPAPTPAKPSK